VVPPAILRGRPKCEGAVKLRVAVNGPFVYPSPLSWTFFPGGRTQGCRIRGARAPRSGSRRLGGRPRPHPTSVTPPHLRHPGGRRGPPKGAAGRWILAFAGMTEEVRAGSRVVAAWGLVE